MYLDWQLMYMLKCALTLVVPIHVHVLTRHAFNRECGHTQVITISYPPIPTHTHPHIPITRGMLYVCHGVGEYMGRYEKLGEFLAENDILMFGHDHGRLCVTGQCLQVHLSLWYEAGCNECGLL